MPHANKNISGQPDSLKKALGEYKYLYLIGSVYVVFEIILALSLGARPDEFVFVLDCFVFTTLFMGFCLGAIFSFFLVPSLLHACAQRKGLKEASKIFDSYVSTWMTPRRVAALLTGYALYIQIAFIGVAKSLIAHINPYQWDPLLSHLDFVIHGNHYPHELIVPLVKKLHLAVVLDMIYMVWFPYKIFVFAYCVFVDPDWQRQRRLIFSCLMGWILLGTVIATAFSSVGPFFFHDYYPGLADPYAGLVANVYAVSEKTPLYMPGIARILLDFRNNGNIINLNALSAMPSMHVGIVWLIVLYAWSVNRFFFAGALAFFLLIFMGSIYLGWHYAIDSYVAIACMSLIWVMAGRLLREARSPAALKSAA